METFLLWNRTNYAESLSNAFGKDCVITCSEDLVECLQQPEKISSLIVLCELDWNLKGEATNRQHLQGIEIVKALRRKYELKIPVLFVSFHSLTRISNSEREILQTTGHDFYQLPATPKDFKKIFTKSASEGSILRKLSDMELDDNKSFYCSKEGILSHELHSLNHFEGEILTAENHDYLKKELEGFIVRIYTLFLADYDNDLTKFQTHWSTIKEGESIKDAVSLIHTMGEALQNTYSENTDDNEVRKSADKYPWKILLLDDQIDESHDLVKQMQENNFTVICVSNAADATEELKKDWKKENSIMVVIADYRLYEKGIVPPRHQKIQGYQFLKNIATSDHLVRLVAFSGLQRRFLFNSFKHYNIRTEVKSKKDYIVTKETRQIFCEEIKEIAEENWAAIEAMPSKCAGFEKSLQDAYKQFRMHQDFNKMESNVSLTAKEYVYEIQQQITDGLEIKIGAIDFIKSPLAKTKKDEEAYFKRFQNYMVARRIALWLYAANKKGLPVNIESRKIAEILTDQKYPTDAYRQILSTNLGLSLDDFPKNITIEERSWLQYEMELNIFRDINMIVPVFNQIAKNYKDFILSSEVLQDAIKKSKFSLEHKYKQTNYSIEFEKNFTPILKTATDVRVLFLIIAQHIKKEKNKAELIKPLISRLRLSLFESREKVIYLKNLFQYFNALNGILNKEKSVLRNQSTNLKVKTDFTDKSKSSINKVYDRIFDLLSANEFPNENDKADVWTVFLKGEEVVAEIGKLSEENRIKFYTELSKAINKENESIGDELNERHGGSKPSEQDDDNADDFSDFLDDTDFN